MHGIIPEIISPVAGLFDGNKGLPDWLDHHPEPVLPPGFTA